MSATRIDDFGVVRCATGEPGHQIVVVRAGNRVCGGCVECPQPAWDDLASVAWFDSHENLWLLLKWLGDMSPSTTRHVIEKPWKWETEFQTAAAARDHERTHDGHEVLQDGTSDTDAYCDFEDCDWRCVDGVANVEALAVSS